jgi:DNA-binding response OmpR family regulator
MNLHFSDQAYLALIDDDPHSARLLMRMLIAHGAPGIEWFGDGEAGARRIAGILGQPGAERPSLVIVDLKGPPTVARDCIAAIRALRDAEKLLIVAMAPDLQRDARDSLIAAGADAVFQRYDDLTEFRRETANLVSFWVRSQRFRAVGV